MFCSLMNCLLGNNSNNNGCGCRPQPRSLLSTINPNCSSNRGASDPACRSVAGDLNSVFSNCDRLPFSGGCGNNCGNSNSNCGCGNNSGGCCCKCAQFFA